MLNKFFKKSLNQSFFKKIKLTSTLSIKFALFTTSKFLILKNKNNQIFYFKLLNLFNFICKDTYLYFIFVCDDFKSIDFLYLHILRFNLFLKFISRAHVTTFLIRGVGLKVSFTENDPTLLSLKFGYSHLIWLTIPFTIFVTILKKKIIFSSFNKMLLGNFSHLFYSYKPINVFTGKGLLKKQKRRFRLKEYVKKI